MRRHSYPHNARPAPDESHVGGNGGSGARRLIFQIQKAVPRGDEKQRAFAYTSITRGRREERGRILRAAAPANVKSGDLIRPLVERIGHWPPLPSPLLFRCGVTRAVLRGPKVSSLARINRNFQVGSFYPAARLQHRSRRDGIRILNLEWEMQRSASAFSPPIQRENVNKYSDTARTISSLLRVQRSREFDALASARECFAQLMDSRCTSVSVHGKRTRARMCVQVHGRAERP